MKATSLAKAIEDRGIRTVLNLRGINADEPWYVAEREATTSHGATQIDISMSSCLWMSRAQARDIVRILDTAEYPMIVHCQHGAERTGLVTAISELLRPDGSLASARAQFSLYYLFLDARDGAMMVDHIDQYEDWLAREGLAHAPAHFRRWIADGFQPGHPSREDWPYDPYPLVITRPGLEGETLAGPAPTAGERR